MVFRADSMVALRVHSHRVEEPADSEEWDKWLRWEEWDRWDRWEEWEAWDRWEEWAEPVDSDLEDSRRRKRRRTKWRCTNRLTHDLLFLHPLSPCLFISNKPVFSSVPCLTHLIAYIDRWSSSLNPSGKSDSIRSFHL